MRLVSSVFFNTVVFNCAGKSSSERLLTRGACYVRAGGHRANQVARQLFRTTPHDAHARQIGCAPSHEPEQRVQRILLAVRDVRQLVREDADHPFV